MPADPNTTGSFVVDGAEFEAYAEEVPASELQGLLVTQEGFALVCDEVMSCHAEYGKQAGIADSEITDLAETNERIARIDVFLPIYVKAAEKLTHTRAKLEDKRQRIILDAAKSVDRRADRHPMLLAKYKKTREYRSAIAKKGLQTKAKNKKDAAAGEPKAAPQVPAAHEVPEAPATT